MIVIGYQGIGKSTLSNKDLRFIDLESGNFWIDGKRSDDWYRPYCKIAEHLSQQGRIVFTSSHKVVREQLSISEEQIICCVPDLNLKDDWIRKLENRYSASKLEKDYKALMNAKDCYEENITDIANSGYSVLWLENMDYKLDDLLLNCIIEI